MSLSIKRFLKSDSSFKANPFMRLVILIKNYTNWEKILRKSCVARGDNVAVLCMVLCRSLRDLRSDDTDN